MAKLTIQRPDAAPVVHELSGGVATIGREADNAIVIPDGSVSRHHAEIVFNGEGFILRDLGSANGTAVNYDPVTEGSLKDGDIIHFGLVESILATEPLPVARKPESAPPASVPAATVAAGGPSVVGLPPAVVPPPTAKPVESTPKVIVPPTVGTGGPHVEPPPTAVPPPPTAKPVEKKPPIVVAPTRDSSGPRVVPPVVAPLPVATRSESVPPVVVPPARKDAGRAGVKPLIPAVPAVSVAKKPEAVTPAKAPLPKPAPARPDLVRPTPEAKPPPPVAKKPESVSPAPTTPPKADVRPASPVPAAPVVERPPVAKKPESVPPAIIPSLKPAAGRSHPLPSVPVVVRPPVAKKPGIVAPVIVPPKRDDAVRLEPVPLAPAAKPVPAAKKSAIAAPVIAPTANRGPSQLGPVPLVLPVKPAAAVKDSDRVTLDAAPPANKRRLLIYVTACLLVVAAGAVFLPRHPQHQETRPPEPTKATVYSAKSTKEFWDKIQQIEVLGNQRGGGVDFDQYPKLASGMFDFSRFDNEAFESFLGKLNQRSQVMNRVADDLGSLDKNGVDADLLAYTNDLRGQWKGGAAVDTDYGLLVAGLQEQKRRFTSPDAVELRRFNTSMGNNSLELEYQQNQESVRTLVSRWATQRDAHMSDTMKILAREKQIGVLLTERYKTEFK